MSSLRLIFFLYLISCLIYPGHLSYSQDSEFERLYRKGESFRSQMQLDSALVYLKKAAEISQAEQNWRGYVSSLLSLSDYRLRKSNPRKADEYVHLALEKSLQELGEGDTLTAHCYTRTSRGHIIGRNYELAAQTLQKALKIYGSAFGETHKHTANVYDKIGSAYRRSGHYDKALKYYHKALTIKQALYGSDGPELVGITYELARTHYKLTNFERAKVLCQRGLEILKRNEKIIPEQSKLKFVLLYHLFGEVSRALADYARAIEFYNEAHKWNVRLLGVYPRKLALHNMNLGLAFLGLQEFDKALAHFQGMHSAINEADKSYYEANNQYVRAAAYSFMAQAFERIEPDSALAYYKRAQTIWLQNEENNPHHLGKLHSDLGRLYAGQMNRYNQAIESFDKAVKYRIASGGTKNKGLAQTYRFVGDAHLKQKKYSSALLAYQKALAAARLDFSETDIYRNPVVTDEKPDIYLINVLAAKARAMSEWAEFRKKDPVQKKYIRDLEFSLETFELVSQLIEKVRTSYEATGSKLLLSKDAKEFYERAIATSLKLANIPGEEHFKYSAFNFAELSKAAILESQLRTLNATSLSGIADNLITESKVLQSHLVAINTDLLNEKQKAEKDSTKIVELQSRYFALNNEQQALLRKFEESYPRYYELRHQKRQLDVTELQETLSDDTAMLEYIIGDSTLYIFVVTNALLEIEAVPIRSDLAKQVRTFYTSIRRVLDRKNYVTKAFELYEVLIRPVESHLASKEKLIIIPDEELFFVPFAALLTEEVASGGETDFSKLKYLLYDYDISYHYSARLLLNKSKTALAEDYPSQFVGFAPVFSAEKENGTLLASNQPVFRGFMDFEGAPTRDGKRFEELKYSEKEVREIIGLFKAHKQNGMGYFHQQASEENFKQNIRTHQIVHVSTHGVVNHEQPELSALAFSQPRDSQQNEDGILYAGESFNLDLTTDLLVLSSCESGIGKLAKGEGVLSLTRGFLYSGAPNIITSLWKVFDQHTSQLMLAFYENLLNGQSYSAALRGAKLELIKNGLTAHPASWASFVLVGG